MKKRLTITRSITRYQQHRNTVQSQCPRWAALQQTTTAPALQPALQRNITGRANHGKKKHQVPGPPRSSPFSDHAQTARTPPDSSGTSWGSRPRPLLPLTPGACPTDQPPVHRSLIHCQRTTAPIALLLPQMSLPVAPAHSPGRSDSRERQNLQTAPTSIE